MVQLSEMKRVYARKRLHITLPTIIYGILLGARVLAQKKAGVIKNEQEERNRVIRSIEDFWTKDCTPTYAAASLPPPHAIPVLSVRSGWDLLLRSLNLPKGSEVLMSALTIKDMYGIVNHNGLVPVPLDLDILTMNVKYEMVEKAITPKTKIIILAHIFGTQPDVKIVEKVCALAKSKGIIVVEDGAQIYSGTMSGGNYMGIPQSDVKMFSFGIIKTCTTATGGLMLVNDGLKEAITRMKQIHNSSPAQEEMEYFKKIIKILIVFTLFKPIPLGFVILYCKQRKMTFDEFITPLLRGFPGELLASIRQQPSLSILRMMDYRFRNYDNSDCIKRAYNGYLASSLLPLSLPPPPIPANMKRSQFEYIRKAADKAREKLLKNKQMVQLFDKLVLQPGRQAIGFHYWLFPLMVENPKAILESYRGSNYDITQGASQLSVVPLPPNATPDMEPKEVKYLMNRLVYFPVYEQMNVREIQQMMEQFVKKMLDRSAKGETLSETNAPQVRARL